MNNNCWWVFWILFYIYWKISFVWFFQVIMKTQFRDPHGILNSLHNLSRHPHIFLQLVEAAESFDLCMIRRSTTLSDEQKQILVELARQPLSLRNQARLFLRQYLGRKLPYVAPHLPIPTVLIKFLMYEHSWSKSECLKQEDKFSDLHY